MNRLGFQAKETENSIREPYAKIGDKVVCENGHIVCEFIKTVYVGDLQDVRNQLGYWRQDAPLIGTIYPRCSICGAKFYMHGIFNFKDGWRDPRGLLARYGLIDR